MINTRIKDRFWKPERVECNPEDTLFWGCTHFNHDPKWDVPLWKARGYESSIEHREGLIRNWNQKASHNSIGFLLGDIMFGAGEDTCFFNLLERMYFRELYVLPGNHQAGFKQAIQYSDSSGCYNMLSGKKIIFCPNYFEIILNKKMIVMSHYPILSWNMQANGSWHLFSHVHGSLGKSEVGKKYLDSGAKMYEVSVEKNAHPISLAELEKYFEKKAGGKNERLIL